MEGVPPVYLKGGRKIEERCNEQEVHFFKT